MRPGVLKPPFLPTRDAVIYSSTTKWTLFRAAQRGEIRPAGRRGRSWIWRVSDLDVWMVGTPIEPHADDATAASTRRAPSNSNTTTGDALVRLRAIARGGR